ncbi:MAG: succinyl-diaminopimelate desuccinylase [Acidimicrobiaceae bacterium]|nr:succinyl-diaminopimelate desuccinylase [Acidimicrobiaceae bacterium]
MTSTLVAIPSVSFEEAAIVDFLHNRLNRVPWLETSRIGDNLIARTNMEKGRRLLLGGHTDTVPANNNLEPRLEGETLWGLGAADMKGGLAVMLSLAEAIPSPAFDMTYLFYAREEVAAEHSGLKDIVDAAPELLDADLALLGEPTSGTVEAGCQGTMRFILELKGERAHTARPWMGVNAIHRLDKALNVLNEYRGRKPVIEGCEYHEALQAVRIEGGIAGNVVPDSVALTFNHRVAPDRDLEEAEDFIRSLFSSIITPEDSLTLVDSAPPAKPGLSNPMLASMIGKHDLQARAKLGWTDVAFFDQRGIPAANFGPGDATLAHTQEERITKAAVDSCYLVLKNLIETGL